VLDIRTPREFKSGHIRGARLLDYYSSDFVERLKRLDREKTYLVYCRSGNRSGKSLTIFKRLGFRRVFHLDTGIAGWLKEKYPVDH
jgi:rhodanese-related sulfurtransferase